MKRKIKTNWLKGFLIGAIGALTIIITSCEDEGLLKTDKDFASRSLQTIFVDTFSVKTSTVLMDSLPTSNTSVLVGSYYDPFFGWINSSANFELSYNSFLPETDWVYDSAKLILKYNNYSYGDTTKSVNLTVSELMESIEPRQLTFGGDRVSIFNPSFALYNTSKVKFSPTPITTVSTRFFPNRDSIAISLPKSFGQRLYDTESQIPALVKAEYERTGDVSFKANWFADSYFNGLNLSVPSTTNASIAGFTPSSSVVRLYYTSKNPSNDNEKITRVIDFRLSQGTRQFNSITSNRSGTPSQALSNLTAIPSEATGNVTFVQSGVGIYTKIEFPTVKSFFLNSKIILLEAQLEVGAVQNTYLGNTKPLSLLSIYTTDQTNIVNGILPATSNSPITTRPIVDNEYQITRYIFPITSYLDNQIKASGTIPSFVLAAPAFSGNRPLFSEISRMVIGNRYHPTNKIKLKIYYTQYETNN